MGESGTHLHMKRVAASVLKNEGYDVDVERDCGGTTIDVYGMKDGEVVAVEVGDLSHERATAIKDNVTNLVHVPYDDVLFNNSGSKTTGDKRTNVVVNGDDWEQLAEYVGSRGRSETVRQLIRMYNQLAEEV